MRDGGRGGQRGFPFSHSGLVAKQHWNTSAIAGGSGSGQRVQRAVARASASLAAGSQPTNLVNRTAASVASLGRAGSQPELGTNRIVRFVTKQAPASPSAAGYKIWGGVLEKARRGVYCTRLRAHRQPPGSSCRPKSGYFDGGPLACSSYAPQALVKMSSEHAHQGAASWWRAS